MAVTEPRKGGELGTPQAYKAYRTKSCNQSAPPVTLPWATLTTILECVGVLLSVTGICGAGALTAAVILRRSPEVTDRWLQVGTAAGFLFGIPTALLTFIFLERIF